LTQYVDAYGGPMWNVQLAATTLTVLPVLAVFLVAQKQFVQGLAHTGLQEESRRSALPGGLGAGARPSDREAPAADHGQRRPGGEPGTLLLHDRPAGGRRNERARRVGHDVAARVVRDRVHAGPAEVRAARDDPRALDACAGVAADVDRRGARVVVHSGA